jgi:flavin-dependent dehydrogenase
MKNFNLTYDVIIIGAGVAGCATAIALKNQNSDLKIGIIEREIYSNKKISIGETLPPHASQQLQELGIWDGFVSKNFISSYGTSSAWGASELYTNEFLYSPFGYGWSLDRMVFDDFIVKEAEKRGILFFYKTSCIEPSLIGNKWSLKCNSESIELTIHTKFVVDASGKKASFSSKLGIKKNTQDQLIGIYKHYTIKSDTFKIGTCIEADANGWWYSTTLPNNKLVICYMTDNDIASKMQLLKKNALDYLLSKTIHTSKRLTGTEKSTKPTTVAAHSHYLSSVIGDAWLAVGDAASSYDPISSLGIFKSLLMSRYASYAILNYLDGDLSGLKKYQHIINEDYKGYKSKKQEYYNQENRFKNESFWKRRQNK